MIKTRKNQNSLKQSLVSKYLVLLIIVAFSACSAEIDIEQLRTSTLNSDENTAENTEEKDSSLDLDDEVSLPTNVSGSFLACHLIENSATVDGKSNTKVGCSILSDNKDSDLSHANKTSEKTKKIIQENFELSIIPPPITGVTYSISKVEDQNSLIDFNLEINANNLISSATYLNKSVMVLDYNEQAVNADDSAISLNGVVNRIAQLKAPLSDILEGVSNTIQNTTEDLETPAPTKNYTIPGRIMFDGSSEEIGQTKLTETGDIIHSIHSISQANNKNFAFGTYNAYNPATQDPGSKSALFLEFNDSLGILNWFSINGTEGGVSSYTSSKVGPDGNVYYTGYHSRKGDTFEWGGSTVTQTTDLQLGVVGILNPYTNLSTAVAPLNPIVATIGQLESSEKLYGLNFEADGSVVAVGTTTRTETNNRPGGYVFTFNLASQAQLYHQYFETNADMYFNDVTVRQDGRYAIAGLTIGDNCSHSNGMIMDMDRTVEDHHGPDGLVYRFFGHGSNNVTFNKVIEREDGKYFVSAIVEFPENIEDSLNPHITTAGNKEVSIYFDKNLEIIYAHLNNGIEVNLNKIANVECAI